MKKTIISALAVIALGALQASAQTSKWKSYLSYYEPTEIETAPGNMLYVLASNGLYSYDKDDQSLQLIDKITALNDAQISHIAWCQAAKRLVITYTDYNIDLLEQNNNAINIADYMNKTMTQDKTVYGIDISGSYAYLSTAFGIVKLNVANAEISDTYQLGFRVDYTYLEGNYLYAASSARGLYRGLTTTNLLDQANWERVGDFTARPKTMDPDDLALVKTLQPGGPKSNNFGFLKMYHGKLYTAGVYDEGKNKAGIQVLEGDDWTIYQDEGISEQTGVKYEAIVCLDIDPNDATHVMAGGRNGLYEFRNGQFEAFYNSKNSPIESYKGENLEYEIIKSVKFDAESNLWLLNSQAPTQAIISRSAAGQWTSHPHSELMKLNDAGYTNKSLGNLIDMTADTRGLTWFVNDHWSTPSVYAYNTKTDSLKSFTNFINDDGTILDNCQPTSLAEDLDGNMWVGTSVGPVYLSPAQVQADEPAFTQVKVPRNDGTNYADYLLSGVGISCVVIDQANRKWFGTYSSGIYLIAADNITELQHFTTDNSGLFSNSILDMAINPTTGELYVATDKGLCSYMSDATTAGDGMTKDNVYAYPNPVRPDYSGPITIKGLDADADVKIVTANGTLVAEGRASGGVYKWYGLDKSGRRVASGVYMVEVATSEGEKGVVCKVAIVR